MGGGVLLVDSLHGPLSSLFSLTAAAGGLWLLAGRLRPSGAALPRNTAAWLERVTREEKVPLRHYLEDVVWPTVALKKLVGSVPVSQEDLDRAFAATFGPRARCRIVVLDSVLGVEKAFDASKYGEMSEREFDDSPQLVQVVVAPHSPFIGETIGAIDFLEKPIARTLAEADEMVAACEKHHVKCALAHQTRYSPRVKVLRELIREGKLGDIVELRGNGKEDPRGGGEDMMVLGTHIFDLMRHLVGDARWCFARINQNGKKALVSEAQQGKEPIGPILGDHITAQGMTAQAIFDVVRSYAGQIGVDVRPHDLRRTFAKLAHKGAAPIEQIQLSLGHSSVQTTERYIGVQQDLTSAPCDALGLRI